MSENRSIDTHSHFITPQRLDQMNEVDSGWNFRREETAPGSFHLHINERRAGPMRLGGFDVERRIQDMDAAGVDIHILSPVPYLFLYESDPEVGERLARLQNDCLADIVSDRPDRFASLATVPLQDPDRAVAELERAMTKLSLRGAEIGTHVRGKNYDHPDFFPSLNARRSLGRSCSSILIR